MVHSPVFNADSDYAIGGSIFLQLLKEVSAVTYATSILPIFKHISIGNGVMVHKEATIQPNLDEQCSK